MSKRIVVYDREQPENVGSVVERDKQTELDEHTGKLVTLPLEPALVELGGVSGYFRRDWGMPGVQLAGMRPARVCPMVLWLAAESGTAVHVAVRFSLDPTQGRRPRGGMWLAANVSQQGSMLGGISAVGATRIDLDELVVDPLEEHIRRQVQDQPHPATPSWIMKLRAPVTVQGEGFFSCCLQAVADGVRIHWTAITQSGVAS